MQTTQQMWATGLGLPSQGTNNPTGWFLWSGCRVWCFIRLAPKLWHRQRRVSRRKWFGASFFSKYSKMPAVVEAEPLSPQRTLWVSPPCLCSSSVSHRIFDAYYTPGTVQSPVGGPRSLSFIPCLCTSLPSGGDRWISKRSPFIVMNITAGVVQVPWNPIKGALDLTGGNPRELLAGSDGSWPVKGGRVW